MVCSSTRKRNKIECYSRYGKGQGRIKKRQITVHNSTYKKLAVQWLNEVFYFITSSGLADSFVLLSTPLRQAQKKNVGCFLNFIKSNCYEESSKKSEGLPVT
ncbi:MAG TPA: hypothetical protein DCD96_06780 [Flavobacteriales bacterium]|nr:hypothetical protein [Flavobacteriales bacterium]